MPPRKHLRLTVADDAFTAHCDICDVGYIVDRARHTGYLRALIGVFFRLHAHRSGRDTAGASDPARLITTLIDEAAAPTRRRRRTASP